MDYIKVLPGYLSKRYHGWHATSYSENKAWFQHLANEGQHPRAMVISCCDSRIHVTSIFGADQGEFFLHRNIANLVPPLFPRWKATRYIRGNRIRRNRAQGGTRYCVGTLKLRRCEGMFGYVHRTRAAVRREIKLCRTLDGYLAPRF